LIEGLQNLKLNKLMKHLLIFGFLLFVAAGGVYYSMHHGAMGDHLRPATDALAPEHSPATTDRPVPTALQSNALPVLGPAAIAKNVTGMSHETIPNSTNTWESVTAARYADLIKEIRQARGNAQ
jgi:hypothetical protein